MNLALLVAAIGAVAVGFGHSILGERWILLPLFRDAALPTTRVGGVRATQRMMRFTWHFFSVVAWITGLVFLNYALGSHADWTVVRVLAACWTVFGVAVFVMSRGRHGAWIAGTVVAIAAWWGTLGM